MLSHLANVAANLSNRISSLLSSRKTPTAPQSGSEHPMGLFKKDLNCYGPIGDIYGDRSLLQTAITTDAFRGGSVQRLGHGEHDGIVVKNTVEMV